MKNKQIKSGFTLLEVILYSMLTVFILSSVTAFLGTVMSAQAKNQTVAEVEQQGIQIMQLMTQSIRSAQGIYTPSRGSSSSSLSLNSGTWQTVFALSGDMITMKEGANAEIQLTSDRVSVSNLTFQNLSRIGTPGSIRISFTLSRVNPGGQNAYEYSETFVTAASLR